MWGRWGGVEIKYLRPHLKKAVPGDAHPHEPVQTGEPGGSQCPLTSETPGMLVCPPLPGRSDRMPGEEHLQQDGI